MIKLLLYGAAGWYLYNKFQSLQGTTTVNVKANPATVKNLVDHFVPADVQKQIEAFNANRSLNSIATAYYDSVSNSMQVAQ